MAYYLRIEDIETIRWFQNLVENSLASDPNSPFLQTNYVFLSAWKHALDNRVSSKEVASAVEEPSVILAEGDSAKLKQKASTKPLSQRQKKALQKAKANKLKEMAADEFVCMEHKTYHGKRRPQSDCDRCWSIFKKLHLDRYDEARKDFLRVQRAKGNA